MIINEFFIIIVASKCLRVGWGEKEKVPTMMIALERLSWQLCHYNEGGNTHFTGCTTASGNNDGHPVKLSLHPVIL